MTLKAIIQRRKKHGFCPAGNKAVGVFGTDFCDYGEITLAPAFLALSAILELTGGSK
jgi:hypothetical protein